MLRRLQDRLTSVRQGSDRIASILCVCVCRGTMNTLSLVSCVYPDHQPDGTVFTDEIFVMSKKIIATINSTGRQSASFIRVASAVGWHVRAQVRANEGLVAEELASLSNVELIEGDLTGPDLKPLLKRLFDGARIAFINTTHWGDEVAIGEACADAAKKAHIVREE
jgi:hypothetical protein